MGWKGIRSQISRKILILE